MTAEIYERVFFHYEYSNQQAPRDKTWGSIFRGVRQQTSIKNQLQLYIFTIKNVIILLYSMLKKNVQHEAAGSGRIIMTVLMLCPAQKRSDNTDKNVCIESPECFCPRQSLFALAKPLAHTSCQNAETGVNRGDCGIENSSKIGLRWGR